MKYIIKRTLILALFSGMMYSCNWDPCGDDAFADCFLDKPDTVLFVLKISHTNNVDSVLVRTYKGKMDDGLMIDSFYSYLDEESYLLAVNNYYSAFVEYYIHGDTIRVVDGQKLRTKETTKCEETCWEIKGDELDLRLKF